MMRGVLAVGACLSYGGLILGGLSAHAHHAISSYYDSGRSVSLQGVIAEFRFISPHPFVVMEAKDANGAAQAWTLEMDNRGELSAIGVTSTTLKPGDRIVVTGSMARNSAQSLYVRKLERPADGFTYEQVGSSPRITSRAR